MKKSWLKILLFAALVIVIVISEIADLDVELAIRWKDLITLKGLIED